MPRHRSHGEVASDPRDRRGVRFPLATLLAVGVCAMTCAGHNSLTAIAEWARRCHQAVLTRLGCPFDPFAGRLRAPGERTLRDVFARVDAAALTAAGFGRLAALTPANAGACGPDGVTNASNVAPTARPPAARTRTNRGAAPSPWTAHAYAERSGMTAAASS
nr:MULTISPECIES: transposase family protein [Streptomyces]